MKRVGEASNLQRPTKLIFGGLINTNTKAIILHILQNITLLV
jgi:hypothetical protein